ncbi:MAG: GNAT family N-acetyltransferase [Bacillota bacterium]
MFLSRPREYYKYSYLEALKEYQAEGLYLKYDIDELRNDFAAFIVELREREDSKYTGRVPETILWLIDEGEYIGRISIRHSLNERLLKYGGNIGYDIRPSKRQAGYGCSILRLGLMKARILGLSQILLTCSSDNLASKKIIEKNGGVFESCIWSEEDNTSILRYWFYM